MKHANTLPNFEAMVRKLLADLEIYAGVTSLNFFKDSFHRQGWQGNTFTAWPNRVTGTDGRAILTKTGNLRDSLRILESSPLKIVFGTSEPYAGIHNNGGTITVRVTPKSKKFFWYMYKATGQAYWKWMALTKKEQLTIHIPKRQFIGESQALMKTLEDWFLNEINKRFKQL